MAIKPKCPEFENHERWLVSYADMVTLLFAVFVVLYAIQMSSQKNLDKKIAGSMQESFNTPLNDIPVDRRVGPSELGVGIFDHFKGDASRPTIIPKYPASPGAIKIIDDEMARVKTVIEERLYGQKKYPDKPKPGFERIVSVVRTEKGFKLQLLAKHFFDSGRTEIAPGALKELDEVAKVLKDLGRPVNIEGHTDSMPSGKGEAGNWELSTMRAVTVLRYFARAHNFPYKSLSASGYADTRPIALDGTVSGRQLNRRIEIHVEYDQNTAADL
jgi:chemotaxis protein MotB